MAAYASLVSLNNLMETIWNHPCPPITFDEEQFRSLCDKVSFLQRFLENQPLNAPQRDLEDEIARTASAVEDAVELDIAAQILADEDDGLRPTLSKAIEDMDLVKQKVFKIQETRGTQDLKPENLISSSILTGPGTTRNFSTVGFDEALIEIMDRLTTQQPKLQILTIIGMGGIGKTTLAKNVYDNLYIVQHFHIRIWVTISQDHRVRNILLEALRFVGETDADTSSSDDEMSQGSDDETSEEAGHESGPKKSRRMVQKSENDLAEQLYQILSGKRYLVVMDDMWSIEAWNDVKRVFPDNSSGSRVMITTRSSDMVTLLGSSAFHMNFLDEDKSWDLLCKNVFAQECCPVELRETGKKIALNCGGLPLSIVVVGGILANSEKTQKQWEYVAQNLHSILSLEDHEHCFNILSLSYSYLPVHLKPCFLYMGVFPEDDKIRVSVLIKLWAAEGFLKPIEGKSLELVARSYLNDLIDRNLILVHERGCNGNVKFVHIHDLLRGLCLRECHKEKFIGVKGMLNFDIFDCIHNKNRFSIHKSTSGERDSLHNVLQGWSSALHIRSILCDFNVVLPLSKLRLLRVFESTDEGLYNEGYSPYDLPHLVNSRYLSFRADWKNLVYPSSIRQLWNLQTIIVKGTWVRPIVLPHEIWEMSQLKHLHIDRHLLPDPSNNPTPGVEPPVLNNLQRLSATLNLRFIEDVIKRIPNVSKLHIVYDDLNDGWSYDWSLHNLGCLNKLESLNCVFPWVQYPYHQVLQGLVFPLSLKKLSLSCTRLYWDEMTKIGSLPHLEVLKLRWESFCGPQWSPVEGEFLCLKFLLIQDCKDLLYWTTGKTHFPRLEYLVLEGLYNLKDIPLDIGEIPTLRTMKLINCSDSAVISATNILNEQESLGNEGLRVQV